MVFTPFHRRCIDLHAGVWHSRSIRSNHTKPQKPGEQWLCHTQRGMVSLGWQSTVPGRDHAMEWMGHHDLVLCGTRVCAVYRVQPAPTRYFKPSLVSQAVCRLPGTEENTDSGPLLNLPAPTEGLANPSAGHEIRSKRTQPVPALVIFTGYGRQP